MSGEPKKATDAHRTDAAARRVDRVLRAYDVIDELLAQVFAPATLRHHNAKRGRFDELDIPQPTFRDQLHLVVSLGIVIDKALALEQRDRQPEGVADVDRWLQHLTDSDR